MKQLLFFFTFIIFTNAIYASFPVSERTINKNGKKSINYYENGYSASNVAFTFKDDTLQTETTEQYHKRMENTGFDISLCQCNDCQKFKGKKVSSQTTKTVLNTLLGVGLFLLIVILIVGLYLFYSILSWFG
jgi:hypothetical protein